MRTRMRMTLFCQHMSTVALPPEAAPAPLPAPFRRPRLKKATNLTLTPKLRARATEIADHRYGISLSALTDRLYALEIKHRSGLLPRAKNGRHGPGARAA